MDKDLIKHHRDKFCRVTFMAGAQPRQTTGILRSIFGPPDGVQPEDGETGFGYLVTGEQWLHLVSHEIQTVASAVRSESIRADTIIHIEEIDIDHAQKLAHAMMDKAESEEVRKKLSVGGGPQA